MFSIFKKKEKNFGTPFDQMNDLFLRLEKNRKKRAQLLKNRKNKTKTPTLQKQRRES